ncbi:uncharacterized protein LOC112555045 isoform X2 [Pomacea canaliculata]|uniref:uncharacterized protein LOC112555045 isoform X2 n=1 Tax=Pomacea canaliculata TaxID=400727 RepID=UPI000D7384F2|nr:uncharacterized protein LOC112555045 isoform X2 [Pomacea canaliculata]
MTRDQMQRDPSNTFIAGSFSDARSYALMSTSVNDDDASKAGHPKSDKAVVPQDRSVVIEAAVSTIRDFSEDSINFTTSTLRKCKHQVLKPYWGLLIFIGWRVFRHDVASARHLGIHIFNFLYPCLLILLLLYTYMYEVVACEWKLNITKDTKILTTLRPVSTTTKNATNITTFATPFLTIVPAKVPTHIINHSPQPCEHIITTYLIPNILHFIAYALGFYFFRIQDNEQLYAMMEKVFLQADHMQGGSSSQQRLVVKTKRFLVCGSVWVSMTLGLQVLYVWAFDFPQLAIFEAYGPVFNWTTFAIELVGRVILNSVILAVVMNYSMQCEMVMFYLRGLTLRLQEKSTDIKTAMKDILLLRQSLGLLNGTISKMTSLVLVILAELTVIGFSILAVNAYDIPKVWTYRSVFPVVWALMLGFPLFQAARVNSVCLRLRKISLEMRVFGYKNSSLLELDSFLQFVHCTKLKAKLFHIPILPSYIISFCILTSFIFLILFQTNSIGPKNYFV